MTILYKIYAQNPEHYDEQGIYVKAWGENEPWQTETDCEEYDAFHNPAQAGFSICDLASAQRWFGEIYKDTGQVVEFEIWP